MFTVNEVKVQIEKMNKERVIKDLGVTFSYRDTVNVSYKSVVSDDKLNLRLTNFMCEVFILTVGKFEYMIYRKGGKLHSVNINKDKDKLQLIKEAIERRDFLEEKDAMKIENGVLKFKDGETGKYDALYIETYGDPDSKKSRESSYSNYTSKSGSNRLAGKLMLVHPNTDDIEPTVNEVIRYIVTKSEDLQEVIAKDNLSSDNLLSILTKLDYVPTNKYMEKKEKLNKRNKRKAKAGEKHAKFFTDELYREFLSSKHSSSYCKTSEVISANSGFYEYVQMIKNNLNGVKLNSISIRSKKTGRLECLVIIEYDEELKAGVIRRVYFDNESYIPPKIFKEILHRHVREYYYRNFDMYGNEYDGEGDCFYIERSKADPNVKYFKDMGAELVNEFIEGSDIERYLIDGKGINMRTSLRYSQPMLTKDEYEEILRKAKGENAPVITYKSAGNELWKLIF